MRQPQHVALSTPTFIIRFLRTLYPFRPVFWPKEPQKPHPDIVVASAARANDRFDASILVLPTSGVGRDCNSTTPYWQGAQIDEFNNFKVWF
jgi:hypothetical protein